MGKSASPMNRKASKGPSFPSASGFTVAAADAIRKRGGRSLDPEVAKAFVSLAQRGALGEPSQGREVWLAADASKFHRPAMVQLAPLAQIDRLFTDAPPPAPFPDLEEAPQVLSVNGGKHHDTETALP